LILTTNRLCFISGKNGKVIFELGIKELNSVVQISYRMGIPNGIYIADNTTKIQVRFSGLWMREIKKV
jgi:hypothetical protein